MNDRIIIGLGHHMQQGKDTVADYLVKNYGFIKIAFADSLKNEVAQLGKRLIIYFKGSEQLFVLDKGNSYMFIQKDGFSSNLHSSIKKYILSNYDKDDGEHFIKFGTLEKDRRLLQLWGDYRRFRYNKNYFVSKVNKLIADNYDKNIVISDVRFKNEADMIRHSGGVLIKIKDRKIKEKYMEHISEHELDDYLFDFEISNDGSFELLYKRVNRIMRKINGNR